MPKFRPVSATTTTGGVVVDATYLKNGLKSAQWSGVLGRFGNVTGTLYTKGVGGPNVLLFAGNDVPDEPCQNVCASPAEGVIRPMIATVTTADALANGRWSADTLALQEARWSTEAIDAEGFSGAVIFVSATQAPIAFFAGDPATTDLCAD